MCESIKAKDRARQQSGANKLIDMKPAMRSYTWPASCWTGGAGSFRNLAVLLFPQTQRIQDRIGAKVLQ